MDSFSKWLTKQEKELKQSNKLPSKLISKKLQKDCEDKAHKLHKNIYKEKYPYKINLPFKHT